MSHSLFWFRSDLRLHDNHGLAAASADGPALALYIATPRQWDFHADAPIKRDFWRRNLVELERRLAELGIPLLHAEVPTYDDVVPLLEQLLPALKIRVLHCNREYPLNERRRDRAVEELCSRLGLRFTVHEDQLLTSPLRLLNQSEAPFKVFTPFARAARALLQQAPPTGAPAVKPQARPKLAPHPLLKSCEELRWPRAEAAWTALWPAGEEHARAALTAFCSERLPDYAQRRDLPATTGTSVLSPYLASGVLSVRECWRESSLFGEESQGVAAWQNEFLWRDFYKHVAWHFSRVCRHLPWRDDVERVPWRHDEAEFARWCEGRTGFPIIDAGMRQLAQTGWMHNRLRMLTASFLCKHLLIDWRWGERYFMQHLVDGDFAANNGGWQWSASTGTDAAPYFRIFNPVTQSQRSDPEGRFIRRFVPELAALDERAIHLPGEMRPADYPEPMVDLAFGRERALAAFASR